MSIPVLGVILAAASAFVVGGAWYAPGTFLPRWQKITGTDDAHMKKAFGSAMGIDAVAALVLAYVLAHFISYTDQVNGVSGISGGLATAFWAWLGFSATTILVNTALDKRDKGIILIQAGERLVTFLLMGLILGAFMR